MDANNQTTENFGSDRNTDNTLAILAHAGGIFFGFIPSLIIWLLKKDEQGSSFIVSSAKEALNFQITVALAFIVSSFLLIIFIGVFLMWLVWLVNIVFCVLGAVSASRGELYRYPYTLRLIN